MNLLVTLFRLPVGLIGVAVVVVFWSFLWLFEIAIGCVALPVYAVVFERSRIQRSFREWPFYCFRRGREKVETIHKWVFED